MLLFWIKNNFFKNLDCNISVFSKKTLDSGVKKKFRNGALGIYLRHNFNFYILLWVRSLTLIKIL